MNNYLKMDKILNNWLILLGILCIFKFSEIHCITVERKAIVDQGGYIIRNAGVNVTGMDLVMESRVADAGETIGNVTLGINAGERHQKWGVAFYGSTTASLSPGLNGNNFVTVYYPTNGLFQHRLHQRQYTFQNCYGNEFFKILNEDEESGNCLAVFIKDGAYVVGFAPCDDISQKIFWTFERYG